MRALHHLERVIASEGPGSIVAILLEGVPGTAGVLVPPPGYLTGVRELCDRHGILLIVDEVMSGFGRTGEWLSWHGERVNPEGIVPDIVTFAKGVNSGYVPVGGVLPSPEVASHFDDAVFPGGLTYSGHPLAAASIVAAIDAMSHEGMIDGARDLGEHVIGPGLAALADAHDVIGEVRGLGVFWAVELVSDRATRDPLPAPAMGELKSQLLDRGIIPFIQENRVHVVPPCNVRQDEISMFLAALDDALREIVRKDLT